MVHLLPYFQGVALFSDKTLKRTSPGREFRSQFRYSVHAGKESSQLYCWVPDKSNLAKESTLLTEHVYSLAQVPVYRCGELFGYGVQPRYRVQPINRAGIEFSLLT
jgi:hypothetical protein